MVGEKPCSSWKRTMNSKMARALSFIMVGLPQFAIRLETDPAGCTAGTRNDADATCTDGHPSTKNPCTPSHSETGGRSDILSPYWFALCPIDSPSLPILPARRTPMEKTDPEACVLCGSPPVDAPRIHVRQEHALDAAVAHRLALCRSHGDELRGGDL